MANHKNYQLWLEWCVRDCVWQHTAKPLEQLLSFWIEQQRVARKKAAQLHGQKNKREMRWRYLQVASEAKLRIRGAQRARQQVYARIKCH